MKKTHIILLVAIMSMIIGLVVYSSDFSTWDSIESAKNKQGRFVHLIARLDTTKLVEYDPEKNPNLLVFFAKDSLGGSTKVIYKNSKPTDFEKSESIVLKGRMRADHFECNDMLLKCPSKYKDKEQLQNKMKEDYGSY